MNLIAQLCYLGWWFFRSRFLGRRKPLQSVIFVTNGCDSTCRHCFKCAEQEEPHFMRYEDFQKHISRCFKEGSRILDVEGVNLLQWKDGDKTPADLFLTAKKEGFYSTSTMVPASQYQEFLKQKMPVDLLWVSITDKTQLAHLSDMKDASLYMVINQENHEQLPEILQFLKAHEGIKQIAFNFHTPFPGTENLALTQEQRKMVIENLLQYKKQGYRIMNTRSGLKNMLHLNFKRHCWICNFIYCDGRRSPQCIDDLGCGICYKCGFSMAGEMNAVFCMKPDTILTGMTKL